MRNGWMPSRTEEGLASGPSAASGSPVRLGRLDCGYSLLLRVCRFVLLPACYLE